MIDVGCKASCLRWGADIRFFVDSRFGDTACTSVSFFSISSWPWRCVLEKKLRSHTSITMHFDHDRYPQHSICSRNEHKRYASPARHTDLPAVMSNARRIRYVKR